MRILVLLGAARPTDQGALTPLAAQLLAVIAGEGIVVDSSREIVADLASYDLVHLLAAGSIERAVRQFLHARRWGCPVVVSGRVPGPGMLPDDPAGRYEAGLWGLVWRGANGVIGLAGEVGGGFGAAAPGQAVVAVELDDPAAGKGLHEAYAAIVEGRAEMADAGAEQWLPGVAPEEYGKHLEDLCQLQLELIAYRDAEYEALRRQLAKAGEGDGAGLWALKGEYERLGEWSRDVAARHEALQADYARLRRWAGDLEAQLRAARASGLRGRMARWFGRG